MSNSALMFLPWSAPSGDICSIYLLLVVAGIQVIVSREIRTINCHYEIYTKCFSSFRSLTLLLDWLCVRGHGSFTDGMFHALATKKKMTSYTEKCNKAILQVGNSGKICCRHKQRSQQCGGVQNEYNFWPLYQVVFMTRFTKQTL